MATRSDRKQVRRSGAVLHDSFLRHRNWRWAKIASLLCLVLILIYAFDNPIPRPEGDTVYGYTLGTIGFGLILWLTALGIRKRRMSPGVWSLKAWTSAHVWLGLSLVVIGTLHTGFHFGWNVHTLAYALMMLVILSGLFGVAVYASLPSRLSENRGELTETQMLEGLRAIDRQLHSAAQPLNARAAGVIQASLDEDAFGGGLRARLRSGKLDNATTRAEHDLRTMAGEIPADALARLLSLLSQKHGLVAQLQRHLRLRAILEIWLYVHVPSTIALIAALIAHVVSVFFYW
ncbi:hypothetical protein Q4F19_10330 [Sphingomonas sp. BIUV-7]|uniref:Ferric reductase like transmembrane component n=1 Tax=Sphingomonas natans TaxID=3063330 RepID=A0ABT8Y8X5_9SPHN|nr:hypothetical protein [Sphingomonas sp. BIUV-7]MDO6414775.1 hypothetical protein [Sphingomonas sp. BIUV-7]